MSSTDILKTASREPSSRAVIGLTTEEAEQLYETVGFNELPHIEVSLLRMFFSQFVGVMPYMLEAACIIALGIRSWPDFAIIFAMLLANGILGFHEELKAKESLDALTNKMEQRIATLRDGQATQLLTRLLVPGDIILLVGGASVPADVEWLKGDVLSIDTAALTGEPIPRKYPSEEHGKLILCGCTVVSGEAYCIVKKTGVNTEIGGSQMAIMEDKSKKRISVFEEKVLLAVKVIISLALIDVLIIFFIQGGARHEFEDNVEELFASCLSIMIASIPVALPLVLQVTMALGAARMANKHNAVITSLPALQDIASMTELCSDKTGTLTTAKITIHKDSITCGEGFTIDDALLYVALSSNRDKKEDPIDRACIHFFDKNSTAELRSAVSKYKLVRSVGFNPIYKRVLWEYIHPTHGKVLVSKGLPNKVIDTADGNTDDAEDQWKVENYKTILPKVSELDQNLSKAGYKTLGVSVKIGENPWRYVAILPMIDPPRHDTGLTISRLKSAGIRVKMITGDHLNIAKETARLINMGTNIHKGEEVRDSSEYRDKMIYDSDGFAQVLPRDKRDVVICLRDTYKKVVGMTGDGVNDAPALSAAQCGIAVDDATDAAKNAAAIILTTPGLSAIFGAVVESRRIFRKLKSYIIYRFAATIQIVSVLSLLIYISNCPINSLYIVLLALANDLTLLPIAYDRQNASSTPEVPDVGPILFVSLLLGALQAGLSLLFAYVASESYIFIGDSSIEHCSRQAQGLMWVQLTVSAELLIFSARTTSFFWMSIRPSYSLIFSIIFGSFIVTLLACASPYFGPIYVVDACFVWVYNILCLLFVDAFKVLVYKLMGTSFEDLEVPEDLHVFVKEIPEGAEEEEEPEVKVMEVAPGEEGVIEVSKFTSSSVIKLNREKGSLIDILSSEGSTSSLPISPGVSRSTSTISISRKNSSLTAIDTARRISQRDLESGEEIREGEEISLTRQGSNIILPSTYSSISSTKLRGGAGINSKIRPHVPSSLTIKK